MVRIGLEDPGLLVAIMTGTKPTNQQPISDLTQSAEIATLANDLQVELKAID